MAAKKGGYNKQCTEDALEGSIGISFQDSQKILRMSSKGRPTKEIAEIWNLLPAEVIRIAAEAGYEEGLSPIVKRLTKDPEEFCCPISQLLYECPVVAGDGNTYDNQCIKDWLAEQARNSRPPTSPLTGTLLKVPVPLNHNQDMASRITSFKEETVAEIPCVAPQLLRIQSFEALHSLLTRAETFIRTLLENDAFATSARRELLQVLLLQIRMPGANYEKVRQEMSTLLREIPDSQMHSLLGTIAEDESDHFRSLLCELSYDMIVRLRNAMKTSQVLCRYWIDQEFACRLVTRLCEEYWFKQLWHLLLENCKDAVGGTEKESWSKATAVFLIAFLDRLMDASRKELCDFDRDCKMFVLGHAQKFLDDRKQAVLFAKGFFKYDLGISEEVLWPPRSSAMILTELASCLDNTKERIDLLVMADKICDKSNVLVRRALIEQVHCHILQVDTLSTSTMPMDMEELFLKLISEVKLPIPNDVLCKLTCKESHLEHFTDEDLMPLARQLCQANRCIDGARVAVCFAQRVEGPSSSFLPKMPSFLAEDAFLFAFRLDPTNVAAANGLVDLAKRVLCAAQSQQDETTEGMARS